MVASTTLSQLRRCLNDIAFPASKDDLVAVAADSGCDDDTVRALQAMPAVTYNNGTQVLASVTVTDGETGPDDEASPGRRDTGSGPAGRD